MTTIDKNILSILESSIPYPAFVVDSECRIIDFNRKGKKFVEEATFNSSLIELLESSLADVVERLFADAKNSDKTVNDKALKKDNGNVNYEVMVSPFVDGVLKTFLVTFKRIIEESINKEFKKFTIITDEVEKKIVDVNILNAVKSIKSAFPFTFIGKSKVQKNIDKLEGFFWIKDERRRYLLVNQKYSVWLGVRPKQLEGRFEEDVVPKYQNTLLNNLDSYIIETTNAVAISGFLSYNPYTGDSDYEIIEFPITDIDNNVVAIIGLSQKVNRESRETGSLSNLSHSIFEKLDSSFIYCDKSLNIKYISKSARKLLDLASSETELKLPEVLKMEKLEENLNAFLSSTESDGHYSGELNNKKIRYSINNLELPDSDNSGLLITLEDKNGIDPITAGKINMIDTIIRSMPQPMFIYDVENLRFLEVNDAALRLYGYNRDEFLEMDLTDLYAPEDIQTLIESSNKKAKSNQFTGPWRQKTRSGGSIVVELSKNDVEYNGKQAHLNIIRDITEKVQNDKKLQLFKAAFDNSSDLIFITDGNGFITYANENAIKVLKYSKPELEKKPFLSLLKEDKRADFNQKVLHADLKGEKKLALEIKKADSSFVDADLSITPVYDFNKELNSLNIIVKTAQQSDVQTETKVEYIEVEKESTGGGIDPGFLSHIFHELLTPVNVIIGFAQELGESIGKPDEEQKEAIDIISENQKVLLQTMDTAAGYAALEGNKVHFKAEELTFVDIIDEIEKETKFTAKSNKLELNYGKISSSLKLKTDKHHFILVVSQFIKYAMQITKESNIFLSASMQDDNRCMVSIRDSRDGITEGLINSLRDMSRKTEDEIRKMYGFSRITTKLFRRIMKILDAKREIIQKEGKPYEYGLSFPEVVEFADFADDDEPLSLKSEDKEPEIEAEVIRESKPEENIEVPKPEPKPVVVEEEPPKEEEKVEFKPPAVEQPKRMTREEPIPLPKQRRTIVEEEGERRTVDLSKLRCIYLEDQVDSQFLFKSQMKELKEIEFAQSFEEALPKIKGKEFDFIVMDINLEGEYNGLDALRVIQKLPGYQKVPVIAVTAYVLPGDRDKFIAAGFKDFISKPVLKDKLVDTLEKIF